MNSVHKVFLATFDLISKGIENVDDYHNGTGYFDPLGQREFDTVEPMKAIDHFGRKVIVFPGVKLDDKEGTSIGNFVVFERYSDAGIDDNSNLVIFHIGRTTMSYKIDEKEKWYLMKTLHRIAEKVKDEPGLASIPSEDLHKKGGGNIYPSDEFFYPFFV